MFPGRPCARRLATATGVPLVCLLAMMTLPGAALATRTAHAAATPVYVFPIPGGRVAAPQTQITFRGLPIGRLGPITVTGSHSGVHTGKVEGDSDGHGGSFLPTKPFTSGEVVTVSTRLNIIGGSGGKYHFTIAEPAPMLPPTHWPSAGRHSNDVMHFHSRPDLEPSAVEVLKHGNTAPGDVFVASQYGPVQDGPEIIDNSGHLVWFKNIPGDDSTSDFRVQTYRGRSVLTWWQGYVTAGVGFGEDIINNGSYVTTHTITGGNGLRPDEHEFQISPWNTALVTAYYPVYWNDSSTKGGSSHEDTLDAVVQEIDIPTGLVLFQWDSLDHVPVSDTYNQNGGGLFDYFHVNSIDVDDDGTLLISSRNCSAIYKVNHNTGKVIWTLGGRHSSFKFEKGATFALQHDARIRSSHDWFLTMFDDGGGPPRFQSPSRGLKLFLDTKHMVASPAGTLFHSPPLTSNFQGNYEQLVGGDNFVGWGQQPYFTEFNSRGQEVWDARFVDFTPSYRAYRFQWNGEPNPKDHPPAIAASKSGSHTVVYASWNGSTRVTAWRVQGGSSATSLHTVASANKSNFETAITVGSESYVAVEALDSKGHVLAHSATVAVH